MVPVNMSRRSGARDAPKSNRGASGTPVLKNDLRALPAELGRLVGLIFSSPAAQVNPIRAAFCGNLLVRRLHRLPGADALATKKGRAEARPVRQGGGAMTG